MPLDPATGEKGWWLEQVADSIVVEAWRRLSGSVDDEAATSCAWEGEAVSWSSAAEGEDDAVGEEMVAHQTPALIHERGGNGGAAP
jgi:hypothetical protein